MKYRLLFFIAILNICFSVGYANTSEPTEKNNKGLHNETTEHNLKSVANLYGLSLEKSFDDLLLDVEEPFIEDASIPAMPSLNNSISPDIQRKIQLIEKGMNEIALADNFVEYLMPQDLITFPVGIRKKIGSGDTAGEFVIGIDSVVLTPTETYFNAFMGITMPGSEKKIYFYGEHIQMSKSGGIQGDARLELLTETPVSISPNTQLVFKGGQGLTFVEWDCGGFKSMALDLDIVFSRDIIVPEDASGMPADGYVTSSLTTQVNSWDDFILEVDIPKFQLTNGNGMSFKVQDAIFDMSDTYNGSGMTFPEGYTSPLIIGENKNLWRGFYIRRAEVHLPQELKQEEKVTETEGEDGEIEYDVEIETTVDNRGSRVNNGRTSFLVDNLILDDVGLTGKFTGYNIITLEKGKLGTWNFSLEEVQVKITANQFEYATFDGLIQLPINKEDKQLDYHAGIYGWQDYTFQVEALDTMNIPMFAASNVEVLPNSSLEVTVESGRFKPKANLYGSMDIQLSDPGVSLAAMEFQNLQIQTVAPKISAEYFSVSSDAANQALAGFGLSIDEVSLTSDPETGWVGLGIETSIALSKDFGGTTSFVIWGEEKLSGSYAFRKIQLKKIEVDITKPGTFSLYGAVHFIDGDPVYGKGFQGMLDLKLESISAGVESMVLFGKVEGHRYWYADVLGTFGASGIPMGTINLMGIGGGLYYGIEQAGVAPCGEGEIGCSLSGIKYVPNEDVGLGFKATAVVSIPSGIMTADATFEMSFTTRGGLNQMSFNGSANVAVNKFTGLELDQFTESVQSVAAAGKSKEGENLPEIATSKDVGLTAKLNMLYDHPNKTFNASLALTLNAPPVTGGGLSVMHFSPEKWYIHVGTPEAPIAVNVANLFESSGYFMAGYKMPEPPTPPGKVSSILGGMDLSYMDDVSNLEKGLGFAFGVHFGAGFSRGENDGEAKSGRKSFLIFYGKFSFGAGMDVMMANYGSDATCAGRSGPLGINGWYANGQMYAYLEAEIGISVKKPRFIKGDYQILDLAVAAVLQARGPNPFWMRGIVGGKYNILGGLIKGSCKFEFEMGEKCQIEGEDSMLSNIDIIADLTPADSKTDINVFTTPQVAFNMEVGKVFELKDYDGNTHKFRAVLDYFRVFDESKNEVTGDLEWNSTGDVLIFNPYEILPGETTLVATVKVHFEEDKNGSWKKIDGEDQERTHVFTSGEEPKYLVASNIEYTYPIEKQFNFYVAEYNKGYIQLQSGRSKLFDIDLSKWKQVARFTTNSGMTEETELLYNVANKEVSFPIPTSLTKEKVYKLELVQSPIVEIDFDANIVKGEKKLNIEDKGKGENTVALRDNKAEGTIEALEENFLYEINFRSSKYTSFNEKFNSFVRENDARLTIGTNVHYLLNQLEGELFDQFEVKGYNEKQLVEIEALFEGQDVSYFDDEIYPMIYKYYPLYGKTFKRDVNVLGVVPTKGIFIDQYPIDLLLKDSEIQSQSSSSYFDGFFIKYSLVYYFQEDFTDLRNKIGNYFINQGVTPPSRFDNLLTGNFPRIKEGRYPYVIRYRLPGKNIITTEIETEVINLVPDHEPEQ
ncbi:hypothetical protein [Sediminitomix flava]|uniref:Uncharacterized protein n=1 Tax=Sediminitomix flava TaxID=379075 RepID=A0A315ZAV1_SEDFL|nr:hypothetical protein [Sediminitomix flava]PWJ42705.1 hypothetical protein BC781_102250 [Sediminitomix flava]